jgi:hypothetical protein
MRSRFQLAPVGCLDLAHLIQSKGGGGPDTELVLPPPRLPVAG